MQKPRRVYEGKGFQRYFGEGYSAISLGLVHPIAPSTLLNLSLHLNGLGEVSQLCDKQADRRQLVALVRHKNVARLRPS